MNSSEFKSFLKQKQALAPRTMTTKADEYATDDNRFHNFEISNILQSLVARPSPERAAWNIGSKHMASIIDILNSDDTYSSGYLDEKFGDLINYIYLIWGMLETRYGHVCQYALPSQYRSDEDEE